MGYEFLIPQRYSGEGAGFTVVVCGLDEEAQYDKIIIYIDERPENRYEVGVCNTDSTRTEKVSFTGLEERRIYHVSAEVYSGEEVRIINTRIPARIAKVNDEVELFSMGKRNGAGGRVRSITPAVRPLGGE